MQHRLDYTALANRYTAKYPVLSYVGTQTSFWVSANVLLTLIIYMNQRLIQELFNVPVAARLGIMLLIAVLLGLLYGVCLGLAGYYLDRTVLRKLSLGKVIVLRVFISFCLLVIVLALLRFALYNSVISPYLFAARISMSIRAWDYLFLLLLIYYLFMTIVIGFINQVNKKYGPGVLVPLLLGRYRVPIEEERIFMFMDLKSSTTTAEKLGHLKYSAFIRDCFQDINEVIYPYTAQVYQYVGDGIVVMWPTDHNIVRNHLCLRFFFACKNQFQDRANYYVANYGLVPVFKAGLHMGKVMAVEIGEIKRDIAYHGDTINTAARIQSLCNEYGKDFLVSEVVLERMGMPADLNVEPLGKVELKGKSEKVGIASVKSLIEAG